MTNVVPIQQMLGLPLTADVSQIIEAIRGQQKALDVQKRRAEAMEEAWKESQARLRRAENPESWRVVFTGDPATVDVDSTPLVHGNLITLEGTGQALFHFRPCCQDLRCECNQVDERGYCSCHKRDE